MPRYPTPSDVLSAILACQTFEQAGELLLDTAGQLIETRLRHHSAELVVLGALIFVRAGDTPRGVLVRATEARPSMSLWQQLRTHARATMVDLFAGQAVGLWGEDPAGLCSSSVRNPLATHALAWPVRAPGSPLVGMYSVELQTTLDTPVLRRAVQSLSAELQHCLDLGGAALLLLPRARTDQPSLNPDLPVQGPEMREILRDLRGFAEVDETLLLRGETGTGKTWMARWCHRASRRAGGPFVTARLHERPEALHAGELFGWKKGAFTGAAQDHVGLMEQAHRGTLFIDEIDKLSLLAQGELLGLLDGHGVRRLGDPRERGVDVRLIVGTNADLEACVAKGTFLGDLYHRINVLPVRLPPLRERRSEIGLWADLFAQRMSARQPGAREGRLDDDARDMLVELEWPGNLRELDSVVRRAWTFAYQRAPQASAVVILRQDVERACLTGAPPTPLWDRVHQAAQGFVDEAVRRSEGSRPLTLEDAESFRGLVLHEAVTRLGLREAFVLFGRDRALSQGNERKLYERQRARAAVLESTLKER